LGQLVERTNVLELRCFEESDEKRPAGDSGSQSSSDAEPRKAA